jgi:hypothetical protein
MNSLTLKHSITFLCTGLWAGLRADDLARSRLFTVMVSVTALLTTALLNSCTVKINGIRASEEVSATTSSTTTATTTAATVTSVTATNADGAYVTGDLITVQVTFSEAVTVVTTGGTPYITLEMGLVDRNATYASGSTTTVLEFTYTLVAGDTNADLDYSATSALNLNGGTINNSAGNASTLTLPTLAGANSIAGQKAVVVCASTSHTALGSGTRTSPYQLCNAAQLASVGATSADWDMHYKLEHDVDLTGYTQVADGTQWIPIGSVATPFSGSFDGNLKTIANLTYADTTKDYLGIFGYMAGGRAEIKNLTISGLSLSGNSYVGGVVGYLNHGKIINVSVSGSIVADNTYVGGITGFSYTGIIGEAKSVVGITSTGNWTGGIAGYADYGLILNSYNTGNIQGAVYVAGIVGQAQSVAIANVYNTGNISGNYRLGGIVGVMYGDVRNCFSTGNVTGTDNGASTIGPLVGQTSGVNTNCTYSSSATITNNGTGNATNTLGGTSAAIATYNDSTNAPLTSWNFTNTWNSTGAALPTLAPTLLSSGWATCASHLVDAPFAGGAGTLSNPYLICTAAQMNNIGSSTAYWSNQHFKLLADISLSAYSGTQYNVIGTLAAPFLISTFNGDGHVISDLNFSNTAISYVGLFGNVSSSAIGLIGLAAPNVIGGNNYTGGIAGQLTSYGTIYDSYVKGGTITGKVYVGGITGATATRSTLRNSYSTATVTGTTSVIGGVIGSQSGGLFLNLFSVGDVVANVAATATRRDSGSAGGGVVSGIYYNSNSTCTNCSAAGSGTAVDVGGADPSTYFYDKTKAPLTSWDFTNVWLENAADYPTFQP